MPEDLRVNGWLVIPGSELHERFSRSSGPGGQSVNTADSRVELSFDVERSATLPEWARDRALERLATRLSGGVLTVAASVERSQLANRQDARAGWPPCSGTPSPRRSARGSRPGHAGERTSGGWKASATAGRSSAPAASTAATPSEMPGYSSATSTTIASWVDRAMTTTASVSGEGFSSRCGTCGGTHT